MNMALLLPLFLFTLQEDSTKEPHPWKPLARVNQSLDRGILEFLKGTPVGEAFKGFDKVVLLEKGLRGALKEGGVVSATSIAIEVDIDFERGGSRVYRLGLLVHFNGDRIEFLQFDGRAVGNEKPSRYLATGDFPAPHHALGQAFEAFVKVLQGENAAAYVPFIDVDAWAKKVSSEESREQFKKSIKHSKKGAEAVLAAVKEVKYDTIHVRVDDQSFAAIGEDGSWLGIIRGELEMDKKTGLIYQLDKYRPFP